MGLSALHLPAGRAAPDAGGAGATARPIPEHGDQAGDPPLHGFWPLGRRTVSRPPSARGVGGVGAVSTAVDYARLTFVGSDVRGMVPATTGRHAQVGQRRSPSAVAGPDPAAGGTTLP